MNEPAVFSLPFSQGGGAVGTLPLDAQQGEAGERSTHAELQQPVRVGNGARLLPGARARLERRATIRVMPFGLRRHSTLDGFLDGRQPFQWEHLEMALPQLLNMGLSGVPLWASTSVAFQAMPARIVARWVQVGALFPFCRAHSCAGYISNEPWNFGPQVEAIARQALRLRYRLLPYLIHSFGMPASVGAPVMRPLLYQYPNDPLTAYLYDQFLLGPFLMAAPVLRPGVRARSVYLPEGDWYAWDNGEVLQGGQQILADAPLEHMPLYVRGGAIYL
jgi:alpha-glucosidase